VESWPRSTFTNEIRHQSSGRLEYKWHLDEALISIGGKNHVVLSRFFAAAITGLGDLPLEYYWAFPTQC
jgi:transposase-like protein